MKRTGKHPESALTAAFVRSKKTPGKYADGGGLYLIVDDSGAKRWMLRTVVRGKRTDIGLGGVGLVSLSEAREQARDLRKIAREGGDPLEVRRKRSATVPTFAVAARTVHEERQAGWRNEKHQKQWLTTLERYANPVFGDRRVDQIESADVLRVLSPIWLTKAETARRVAQRIRVVMDWSKAAGHRLGDNPVEGALLGLPKQPERAKHHSALPYADVPDFIQLLREEGGLEVPRLAFEFLILTAARTGEVLHARWNEINLSEKTWTISGDRMKAGRVHRVPLSGRALDILKRAQTVAGESEYVFPSQDPEKPLSNMVFLMALRRMKVDATAHGFRSAFRDWASETTSFPHEACEAALAHTLKSKTEAAYRRGDLFEKRRKLMQAWSDYVASAGGKVLPLSVA